LNVTEPVAGNYYPMNALSFIKDSTANSQFTIVTDRSRGCASLKNGELETMVYRRLLHDDYRGVGEPLNQSYVLRGKEQLIFASPSKSASSFRARSLRLNHPPIIAFGQPSSSSWSNHVTSFAPMTALPLNVELLTLKTNADGSVIFRLHHLYAVGEDSLLSRDVKVDLGALFKNLKPAQVLELGLSANQLKSNIHRYQWLTNPKQDEPKKFVDLEDNVIVLRPMEIRTFKVIFRV